ncbi:UDP-glycosyltransferase 87A1 [Cajanus cajan]|uniref:Cytokinin-O-glucosyltransferase 2 n=1 Tax=Cajanus cajan TaxID=3821 RepID=A0A151UAI3_CAJCA|nr:UDP-glycosyltransferase 87A1 [Cajanus cajan]KYP76201.1 Cytokinin-O-glucosyltransferase 2 [Cajanus cajan]
MEVESHVVVVPYPSWGHINPMMNMSKILVSKNTNIHVTFVVTQHWLATTAAQPKPHNNITLASLPDLASAANTLGDVVHAVMTQMEAPLEDLLRRLQPPPTFLICDAFLFWAVAVANRRKIPVAAFWTTTPSELWLLYFHIFQRNQRGGQNSFFDYIPSISWIRQADIPLLDENNRQILQWALKSCEWLHKAQYLLLPSIYELEPQVVDALKATFSIPIYTIGPNIPYFSVKEISFHTNGDNHGYMDWLDHQPKGSVLYISYGSYLSISNTQMDEIANALHDSKVRFFWVTRGEENPRLKEICGHLGLIVAWCDQLRVLLHPSIGGYWTHCGWNSVIEGVFAGVPFLTFPIALDQPLISKIIVEDWKVGWRVKKDDKLDTLVKRDEIAMLLRKFMQLDSDVGRDIRKKAKELQHMAQMAVSKNGSSETNIKAFLKNIVQSGSNIAQIQNGIDNLN